MSLPPKLKEAAEAELEKLKSDKSSGNYYFQHDMNDEASAFIDGVQWLFDYLSSQELEFDPIEAEYIIKALKVTNDQLNQMREIKQAKLDIAVEALERVVGMVEQWTDEHGQRRTEEIYASKIAREALAKIKDEPVR